MRANYSSFVLLNEIKDRWVRARPGANYHNHEPSTQLGTEDTACTQRSNSTLPVPPIMPPSLEHHESMG